MKEIVEVHLVWSDDGWQVTVQLEYFGSFS